MSWLGLDSICSSQEVGQAVRRLPRAGKIGTLCRDVCRNEDLEEMLQFWRRFWLFQDSHHMRLMLLGAFAVVVTAPAAARPTRIDIPVQIDPNSSVYVLWVKVRADDGRTLVSGYVRQKRWFARHRGDLHIAFLRDGQLVACRETNWKKYRLHSRGQWRFATSVDVAATSIDSVWISHVIHDGAAARSPESGAACAGSTDPAELDASGAGSS